MDFTLVCLCLEAILLIPGIDARNVMLVPVETKTVNTKGATHEISRYKLVPDDESTGPNDDVISHTTEEQNDSKILRILPGKSKDDSTDVDDVNPKIIHEITVNSENSKAIKSPGLGKYHLVLGENAEVENDESKQEDTGSSNINVKVTTTQNENTNIRRNSNDGEEVGHNNDASQWYYKHIGEKDAKNVKLVPVETKTVNTNGATHEISRYILVPNGNSNDLSDDVTRKSFNIESTASSHTIGGQSESKLVRISSGKTAATATVKSEQSIKSPGSVKYHLILGNTKTENNDSKKDGTQVSDSSLERNGEKVKSKSNKEYNNVNIKVITTENEDTNIGPNSNNGVRQNTDGTQWYYQDGSKKLQTKAVLGVNDDENEEQNRNIKADNGVYGKITQKKRLSEETASDHSDYEHHKTETITKSLHKPTKLTSIKFEELPIKWNTATVGENGYHPLLSSIAINKTFTLPGKRGRFKLIHEDDEDIDIIDKKPIFKHHTMVSQGRSHYYVNKYFTGNSKHKNDDDDENTDLSLRSLTIDSNGQNRHAKSILEHTHLNTNNENGEFQLELAKSNLRNSSPSDSHTEINKINSDNTVLITKSHTVSHTENENKGAQKLTMKTSNLISSLSSDDKGSEQVHTLLRFLPGSSSTIENKGETTLTFNKTNYAPLSKENSEHRNPSEHHVIVNKYVTKNSHEEPKLHDTNISLQTVVEAPTSKEAGMVFNEESQSYIDQEEPKDTNILEMKSSNTDENIQAIPLNDATSQFGLVPVIENSESNQISNKDYNLRATPNIIKTTHLPPEIENKLEVIPLKHVAHITDSSHTKGVTEYSRVIVPTIYHTSNAKPIVITSGNYQEYSSKDGAKYDDKNDVLPKLVSRVYTEEMQPTVIDTVGRTGDFHEVSSTSDAIQKNLPEIINEEIDSTLISQINKSELAPSLDTTDTVTTFVTNNSNEKPLTDGVIDITTNEINKVAVSKPKSSKNEIDRVPVVDTTIDDSSINVNRNLNHSTSYDLNFFVPTTTNSQEVNYLGRSQDSKNDEEEKDFQDNLHGGDGYMPINQIESQIGITEASLNLEKLPTTQEVLDADDIKISTSPTEGNVVAAKSSENHPKSDYNYLETRHGDGNNVEEPDVDIRNNSKDEYQVSGVGSEPIHQNEAQIDVTLPNSHDNTLISKVNNVDKNKDSVSKTENSHIVVKSSHNHINVLNYLGTKHGDKDNTEEKVESQNELEERYLKAGIDSSPRNQNKAEIGMPKSLPDTHEFSEIDDKHKNYVSINEQTPIKLSQNHINVVNYLGTRNENKNNLKEKDYPVINAEEEFPRARTGTSPINHTEIGLLNTEISNDMETSYENEDFLPENEFNWDNDESLNNHANIHNILPIEENYSTLENIQITNALPDMNTESAEIETKKYDSNQLPRIYSPEVNNHKKYIAPSNENVLVSDDDENLRFRFGNAHPNTLPTQVTNSEESDDLADSLGYNIGTLITTDETDPNPMHGFQPENNLALTSEIDSFESDEPDVPEIRKVVKDTVSGTVLEGEEETGSLYTYRLGNSNSHTNPVDKTKYIDLAYQNSNHGIIRNNQNYNVAGNHYPSHKISHVQAQSYHVIDGQTQAEFKQYLQYVFHYLITNNILADINTQYAFAGHGVDKRQVVMQVVIQYLQELGVHEQISQEHFRILSQHLVQLILQHSNNRYHGIKNHNIKRIYEDKPNAASANPTVHSYDYSAIPNGIARNSRHRLLVDNISLHNYLFEDVNANNIGTIVIKNIYNSVQNVITRLRKQGVPEAAILQFITEVKKNLNTDDIQTFMSECQTQICKGLAQRIDMIARQFLQTCKRYPIYRY